MTTELWWRNPPPYLSQLKEVVTQVNVVWDIAYITHYNIDPQIYMRMNFGPDAGWRYMVMYPMERYAYLYDRTGQLAIFPMWDASEDEAEDLIDMVEGQVLNQEHRVIIYGLDSKYRKEQLFDVATVQRANPEVIMHVFNGYAFSMLFGMQFKSCDFAPREAAARGTIFLPSGKTLHIDDLEKARLWVESLGFTIGELKERNARIKYNIVSASWAAKYFSELPIFQGKIRYVPIDSAVGAEVLKRSTPIKGSKMALQSADMKACDFCSMWSACRYYREGSVCTLPGSDYNEIAKQLGTRDAFAIGSGIAELLKINVDRIEDARRVEKARTTVALTAAISGDEEDDDDSKPGRKSTKAPSSIDSELTKLIDSTVKHGLALANLYKVPAEGKGSNGKVVINITGGGDSGTADLRATPAITRELASRAVMEIEQGGVAREDITEEQIMEWLASNIVEGEVVEEEVK